MKQNYIVLFSLVALLFLFSSCNSNNQEFPNYNTGTQGLVFNLMENNPPQKVFAGDSFPITILIENKGAYHLIDPLLPTYNQWAIKEGVNHVNFASLSLNYDDLYFQDVIPAMNQSREKIFLAGKSLFYPDGESRIMDVAILKSNSLNGRKGAKESISLNLCYPYETEVVERICIDNDPYDQDKREKICHAEDLSFSQGQGAPVMVSSIDLQTATTGYITQDVKSYNPQFDADGNVVAWKDELEKKTVTMVTPSINIAFENVGDGVVVRAKNFGEQQLCGPNSDLAIGSVNVRAFIGGTPLNCSFGGVARLLDNRGEISCFLPPEKAFEVNTNYFATLRVELSYTYKTSKQVDIEIDDSMNQHTPIIVVPANSCEDFNNNKRSCQSFGGAFNSELNCFWCDETKQCLSNSCNECNLKTAYEPTHSCIDACPVNGQPKVSNSPPNQGTILLECANAGGVTDSNKVACGCDSFRYQFIEGSPVCPPALALTETKSGTSSRSGVTTVLTLPSFVQQGIPGVLCYVGMTGNGANSEVKKVQFNMATTEDVANGVASYFLNGQTWQDIGQDWLRNHVS